MRPVGSRTSESEGMMMEGEVRVFCGKSKLPSH